MTVAVEPQPNRRETTPMLEPIPDSEMPEVLDTVRPEQESSRADDLRPWVQRIVAAVEYRGDGDREDVRSILREFAELAGCTCHAHTAGES